MRGECAPCRRAGHLCPAALLAPRVEGEGAEPMCLDCADGRPCVALRCWGQGREESSVSARLGMTGEVEFARKEAAVIHRTPLELGITQTLPDIRQRKAISLLWTDDSRPDRCVPRSSGIAKQTMRTIAPAVPATVRNQVGREESETVNYGTKCAFEGCEMRAYDGRKYCTAKHHYKNKPAAQDKSAGRNKSPATLLQTVEIDVQQPIKAALMRTLDKAEGAVGPVRIKIEIELSEAEIDQIWDRLDTAQRQAFLATGLRAALLV